MNDKVAYRHFETEELNDLCMRIMDRNGVPKEDAKITVDSLIDTELRGVGSHGVNRMVWYSERLRDGGINKMPDVKVIREFGGTAVVDGDNGLGAVVSHFAMNKAIDSAAKMGTAVVTVRNSNHFGAAAYWTEMAAKQGMIAIALTNGGISMAPWGGITKTFATNPIGISVPTKTGDCVTMDVAMTKVAGGKLDMAVKNGEKIPFGLALTANGEPTDDPEAGRKGLLLPIGDHKGYGLAVMFEILSGILSGSNYAKQISFPPQPGKPMNVGHYFQVIKISAMMDMGEYEERMDDLCNMVASSKLAPGVERIFMPGEIENERKEKSAKSGVYLPVVLADQLTTLAE